MDSIPKECILKKYRVYKALKFISVKPRTREEVAKYLKLRWILRPKGKNLHEGYPELGIRLLKKDQSYFSSLATLWYRLKSDGKGYGLGGEKKEPLVQKVSRTMGSKGKVVWTWEITEYGKELMKGAK